MRTAETVARAAPVDILIAVPCLVGGRMAALGEKWSVSRSLGEALVRQGFARYAPSHEDQCGITPTSEVER